MFISASLVTYNIQYSFKIIFCFMNHILKQRSIDDHGHAYDPLRCTNLQQMSDPLVTLFLIFKSLFLLFSLLKERVKAKETNCGPTLAADELFDLIIRRPNWIEDLSRALRDPEVKLDFLADDIEKMISKSTRLS